MDEKPGETPNPLNGEKKEAPVAQEKPVVQEEPVAQEEPVTQEEPVAQEEPVVQEEPVAQEEQAPALEQPATQAEPVNAEEQPVANTQPVAETQPATEAQPVEGVQTMEEVKPKKKTGLIIGVIICLLAVIGGGVAAAILLSQNNNSSSDPVSVAMEKLMSGNIPNGIAVNGTIDAQTKGSGMPFKQLKMSLKSEADTSSMVNDSSATLTITDTSNKNYTVKAEEVYTSDGDLFFKLSGVVDALEESGLLNTLNMLSSGSYTTDTASASITMILSLLEAADGEYVRLSAEDMKSLTSGMLNNGNSMLSCITGLANNTDANNSGVAELYKKYSFVSSTDQNIAVKSKNNPVRRIIIDNAKFADFANALNNTDMNEKVSNCLGVKTSSQKLTEDDIEEAMSKLPALYTEVDNNNNFTRLYFETKTEDGCVSTDCADDMDCVTECTSTSVAMTVDLELTPLQTVKVSAPSEYTDFTTLVQQVTYNVYDDVEVKEIEEMEVVE